MISRVCTHVNEYIESCYNCRSILFNKLMKEREDVITEIHRLLIQVEFDKTNNTFWGCQKDDSSGIAHVFIVRRQKPITFLCTQERAQQIVGVLASQLSSIKKCTLCVEMTSSDLTEKDFSGKVKETHTKESN